MTGVLFDLDGTLLDTLEDLTDAVNVSLKAFGYPSRSLEEVRQFVGNGAGQLMRLAVPEGEDFQPVLKAFQEYYPAHCQIKTAPYPGVVELIHSLQMPVAIVSNKPDQAVKRLCSDYFPGIYALGEGPACPRKPAPDMVFKAMEDIGVTKCIYIGDSEVDIATARNAEVPCISVLWGFRDRALLESVGGKYFCQTPEELKTTISALTME
jgi:phosphoglycolate phosphatase